GVDSAAVVAVMAQHTSRVRTFTIGFAEGGDANEIDDARETARLFGTEHTDIEVGATEFLDALPEVIWHLDEPLTTSSALPLYFPARLASGDVKVALAGQGADEPLAGYTRYLGERYGAAWRTLPSPARAATGRLIHAMPRLEPLKRGVRSLAVDDDAERF